MLPYVSQQLTYAALAATLMILAWLGSRRLEKKILHRLALVILCVLPVEMVLAFAIGGHVAFLMVALILYSHFMTLPLLVLFHAWTQGHARSSLIRALAVLSVAILCTDAWALLVAPNQLQERHETIEVKDWISRRPLRVAHVSDLQTVGLCDREERALDMVQQFKPDLVIFTGDYVAGPFEDCAAAVDSARRFLKGLNPPLGVIVVDGHSEPDEIRARVFAGLHHLIHLKNQEITLDWEDGASIRVVGLDVHHPDTAFFSPSQQPGELLLVASHAPDVTRDLNGKGVDLHLAGHTHGGQLVVPGLGPLVTLSDLPRRYARGLNVFGDHLINVSAGIGMEGNHAPRFRLFCPPEIVLIELDGKGNPR